MKTTDTVSPYVKRKTTSYSMSQDGHYFDDEGNYVSPESITFSGEVATPQPNEELDFSGANLSTPVDPYGLIYKQPDGSYIIKSSTILNPTHAAKVEELWGGAVHPAYQKELGVSDIGNPYGIGPNSGYFYAGKDFDPSKLKTDVYERDLDDSFLTKAMGMGAQAAASYLIGGGLANIAGSALGSMGLPISPTTAKVIGNTASSIGQGANPASAIKGGLTAVGGNLIDTSAGLPSGVGSAGLNVLQGADPVNTALGFISKGLETAGLPSDYAKGAQAAIKAAYAAGQTPRRVIINRQTGQARVE